MKSLTQLTSVLAAAALLAVTAQADIILQFDAANNGVSSMAPVVVHPNVDADDMVAGTGLGFSTGSTWNFNGWDPDNTSFADAVADDETWTWGFDVLPGPALNLETMDIRLDRSGTGPDDFEIQVSVNAGAASTVLTHDFMDSDAGVNFLGVDLSGLGTLNPGDSVVFTLAAFNSEGINGTFDMENITFPGGNDGLVLNGTFVPEPNVAGLGLILFALVYSAFRRSR